jgi:hypothetical protein
MRCRGFIRLVVLGSLLFALTAPLRADNCSATQNAPLGPGAAQWRKWEQPLTSTTNYFGTDGKGNPQRDLILQVTFTQCGISSLVQYHALGFWYGLAADGQSLDNTAFRIRIALPPGTWQWQLSCTRRNDVSVSPSTPNCAGDSGLNRSGRFQITSSTSGNFLYKNGFLQKSGNSRYLIAGPPITNYKRFFWLGDTVWSANLLMTYANWQAYINDRSSPTVGAGSQFSLVQMAIAPKAIGSTDTSGNPPFDPIITGPACSSDGPGLCFRWNPKFWKAVDDKIDYANQSGIVVLLASFIEPLSKSTMTGNSTVATAAAEAQIFAQNVAARYYGNFVIYSPGFDNTLPDNSGIINAVGNALGNNSSVLTPRQLVTNHSAGASDVSLYTTYLQSQPWLAFELYQSGSPGSSQADELTKITDRASSMASILYGATPTKPVINGEAVYPGQQTVNDWVPNHTPYRARQTAYYSMLSGAMGYTMGTCGVVDWGVGHGSVGCNASPLWTWTSPDPTLTAKTMKAMKSAFQSIYWEHLKPEPSRIQLLTNINNQPNVNQAPFTADTKSVLAFDGVGAILAYLPNENIGIRISFNASAPHASPVLAAVPYLANANSWPSNWAYSWVSPRNGLPKPPSLPVSPPARFQNGVFDFMKPGCDALSPPGCDAVDWVLKLTDKAKALPGPDDAAAIQVSNEIGSFSNDVRIVTRVVDPAGNSSNEIEIGGAGLTDLGPPMITAEPAGNSLVVWTGDDDNGASVRGRILDAQGNPTSDELIIASGDAANPGHPSVVTLASGNFMVTWSGFDPDGTGPWIRYQTFDRLGSPLTLPAVAESCKPVAGDFPQATSLAPGGLAIAWEMSNGAGIHVLQFDGLGNPSEMDMAQGVGSFPVLETIDGSGSAPRVSYGLYGAAGCVGAGSLSVITNQVSCGQ